MATLKDLVRKIEDTTDFNNNFGRAEREIIKEANLTIDTIIEDVPLFQKNSFLSNLNQINISIPLTLQEAIIEIVTGGGNKAWQKLQSIIDREIDNAIDKIGADTILNSSAYLQKEINKISFDTTIAILDAAISTYGIITEKSNTTISGLINSIIENIYTKLEKLGVTSVLLGFSINYYIFNKLADKLTEMVEQGNYNGKDLTISSVNNIPSINWEKLTTQNITYTNDFILVLNDADLILSVFWGEKDTDISTKINPFNTTLTMAIRETPIPILLVGTASGDNRRNLPLLSFSKIGWHIEDVTFNTEVSMKLKFKDVIFEGHFLHQYFERFIKKYVISYFGDETITNPLGGAFVDELSISFSLYLLQHKHNSINIIKKINFLFLPLAVIPESRSYHDARISTFTLEGVSVYYNNEEISSGSTQLEKPKSSNTLPQSYPV